jgi:hypothetical protein
MSIKDKILSLFSKAPSKNKKPDWDNIFLVDKLPPEWFPLRKRKIWWCAHYSLKAVIEWKNEKIKDLEDYSVDWRSRNTYLMTPRWILKVLKKYKLNYSILNARKLKENEKLFLLKQNLKDGPIILLVANWQTKKSRFNRWKALTHRHYITLWWYNNKKKIFYVYDSNTKRKTNNTVMEWTLEVPYKYILKARWIWATKIIHDYAIAVKY